MAARLVGPAGGPALVCGGQQGRDLGCAKLLLWKQFASNPVLA
jgi:hypothetical protein